MPRRAVAVKVLPADVRDPDLLRMFNAEADVLAHLSAHPAIVTVYQAGISADGRPYIVMEYCPGSLAQRYRIERMPVDEVIAIAVRMAGALESAHRAGLDPPRHQAEQHPHHDVRLGGARRLRHLVVAAARGRRGGARDVDPVECPGGRRRADRRHGRERGVEPRGDGLLAAGRAQPVRTARARAEHPRAACAGGSPARPSCRSPAPTSPMRCSRCSPTAMTPRSRPSLPVGARVRRSRA